jgi:Uma2 family endonuclease
MATADRTTRSEPPSEKSLFDPEGFPWLENGEWMDQQTFHERYERTPEGFRAELIGGSVYVSSPLGFRHGRSTAALITLFGLFSASTPGTDAQANTTTILGEESEPQPDSALLILEDYGGQSRDGDDDYTHGAPELIVEVALSSRSIDLNAKLRDYEGAGVREYLVYDLRGRDLQWFENRDGRFEPIDADEDGLFRSRAFPGLRLDPKALASRDKAALVAALQRGLASPENAAFVEELRRRKEARAGSEPGERQDG